jgi:hypothetical protein
MALTTNLVAYWKLDEASGNASDATGNGNTLTNNGGASYSTGKINNGLGTLNGSSQNLQMGSPVSSAVANVSMGGWVYLSSSSMKGAFAHNGSAAGNGDGYAIGVGNGAMNSNGNHLMVYFDGVAGNDTGVSIGTGWHHIFITRGSTTWHMYIDGVDIGVTYSTTPNTPTSNFTLGFDAANDTGSYFGGMLDEWGFWTRELTPTEVSQLYNGGAGLAYPLTVSSVAPRLASLGVGS